MAAACRRKVKEVRARAGAVWPIQCKGRKFLQRTEAYHLFGNTGKHGDETSEAVPKIGFKAP